MLYQWDWADFFQQDIQPPMRLEHTNHNLLDLPFVQGLQVIVTSVPPFAHEQWMIFHDWLTELSQHHQRAEYWLLVSRLIRDYMDDIRQCLEKDVEQVIRYIQRLLGQSDQIKQFAVIACLYHFAQTSPKAHMLLTYVLQHAGGQSEAVYMDNVMDFYRVLTERQKDVVVLTAYGLTNQEIAEKLCIEQSVVAEHLTTIFAHFQQAIQFNPGKHGTRYRLIHWLTRLFEQYPNLPLDRKL